MNNYLQPLLFAAAITIMESVPFLYNEAYTIQDIKWGWVIGMPLVLLVANLIKENISLLGNNRPIILP